LFWHTIFQRRGYSCCYPKNSRRCTTIGDEGKKRAESENDLDIEFLCKFLVPVPDGDLSDPRHLCHFPLGAPLSTENR